jgi:hypothetical protein
VVVRYVEGKLLGEMRISHRGSKRATVLCRYNGLLRKEDSGHC